MLLPTSKLGIGVGISALFSAFSYGLVYLASNSLRSLHDTGEYTSKETIRTKFGDEFAYYFLSAKDNSNAKIWKTRALILKANKLASSSSFFKNIKDTADDKSLKNICNQKYRSQFPTNNMTRWKEVWIYCSIGGMRPKTIEEARYGLEAKYRKKNYSPVMGTFGRILKNKLIASEDPSNDWFWNIRQKEFKDGNIRTNSTSSYFSTDTTETIRSLCSRAYSMLAPQRGESSFSKPTEAEVEKYCAIRKIGKPGK